MRFGCWVHRHGLLIVIISSGFHMEQQRTPVSKTCRMSAGQQLRPRLVRNRIRPYFSGRRMPTVSSPPGIQRGVRLVRPKGLIFEDRNLRTYEIQTVLRANIECERMF